MKHINLLKLCELAYIYSYIYNIKNIGINLNHVMVFVKYFKQIR